MLHFVWYFLGMISGAAILAALQSRTDTPEADDLFIEDCPECGSECVCYENEQRARALRRLDTAHP